MSKVLYVGDVHAKVSDLDECYKLVDLIETAAKEASLVIFLGDQLHTHLTVNLEALRFWYDTLDRLLEKLPFIRIALLVGNHDKRVGEDVTATHSMMPFAKYSDRVRVIAEPTRLDEAFGITAPKILLTPYYATGDDFIEVCRSHADCKVVVCHQTFDGSVFENGMYAPDGIDADTIPQEQVISGHLHKGQEFGKVWYVGSPRWMTLSDANEEKAIWLVDHAPDGSIRSKVPFDTSTVCTKIIALEDRPETPAVIPDLTGKTVTVDIYGPKDYIRTRTEELYAAGVKRIRTFPVRDSSVSVKESDGIAVAFSKYLAKHRPVRGTDRDTLSTLLKERISWMRA